MLRLSVVHSHLAELPGWFITSRAATSDSTGGPGFSKDRRGDSSKTTDMSTQPLDGTIPTDPILTDDVQPVPPSAAALQLPGPTILFFVHFTLYVLYYLWKISPSGTSH
ncbi:hypothetical protein FRC08_005762 [Ceratobasidium sp. 394]|nr:hypothetical protein FRC08_005762 [Ceratobasidium sp. 394]